MISQNDILELFSPELLHQVFESDAIVSYRYEKMKSFILLVFILNKMYISQLKFYDLNFRGNPIRNFHKANNQIF